MFVTIGARFSRINRRTHHRDTLLVVHGVGRVMNRHPTIIANSFGIASTDSTCRAVAAGRFIVGSTCGATTHIANISCAFRSFTHVPTRSYRGVSFVFIAPRILIGDYRVPTRMPRTLLSSRGPRLTSLRF